MLENYKYGCIFCVAQGQASVAYEKLDHLMLHITSKHKTAMLTPEIKRKTQCVVGSVAIQEKDWDVNIPETTQKGASVKADELLVLVSKFFSRRMGKRMQIGA